MQRTIKKIAGQTRLTPIGEQDFPSLRKDGRIAIELKSGDTIYIMEIKTNQNATAAMKQIERKAYAKKYALEECEIVKVGINFDPAQRTLSDWKIENHVCGGGFSNLL